MPCQAEEVLKAPVGQPAFQQLNGATALYCLPAPRLLCRRLAARYFGGPAPGMLPSPLIGELALRILARLSSDASLLRLQIRTDAPAHRRLWLPSGDRGLSITLRAHFAYVFVISLPVSRFTVVSLLGKATLRE